MKKDGNKGKGGKVYWIKEKKSGRENE